MGIVSVAGSRALVTGASGGLGQAIARKLARSGASLVVTGRNERELAALADETNAMSVRADLTNDADVQHLCDLAAEVDILVSNAALPSSGQVDDYTVEQVDRALAVNLRAP